MTPKVPLDIAMYSLGRSLLPSPSTSKPLAVAMFTHYWRTSLPTSPIVSSPLQDSYPPSPTLSWISPSCSPSLLSSGFKGTHYLYCLQAVFNKVFHLLCWGLNPPLLHRHAFGYGNNLGVRLLITWGSHWPHSEFEISFSTWDLSLVTF